MVLQAREKWWEAEITRLEEAPQEQKWNILDKLTEPIRRMVNGSYVFNDEEIQEMENCTC